MTSPRPATRRVNRGRGHSYLVDGEPYPGVTTILKSVGGGGGLIKWAAENAAACAVAQRGSNLSDSELQALAVGAPDRDRDAAANRGTEAHRLAAALAVGEKVEVPSELVGHVDAYLDFTARHQPEIELVEAVIVNRRYRYAGTLDLICQISGLGRCLLDLKTNRSGPFGEVGLQLSAYGHGETYLEEHGRDIVERPMPAIDTYGVVWLTGDGGWEFYPYQVTEREFRVFLYAQQVHLWLKERAMVVRGAPLARPPAHLAVVS